MLSNEKKRARKVSLVYLWIIRGLYVGSLCLLCGNNKTTENQPNTQSRM